MPREESTTTTKSARKTASTKTSKEGKPKRPPSAYNVFMGENLKKYKEENPGVSHKEAFKVVAQRWAEAPENPNRGKSKEEKEVKKKTEKRKKVEADDEKKSTSAASDADE